MPHPRATTLNGAWKAVPHVRHTPPDGERRGVAVLRAIPAAAGVRPGGFDLELGAAVAAGLPRPVAVRQPRAPPRAVPPNDGVIRGGPGVLGDEVASALRALARRLPLRGHGAGDRAKPRRALDRFLAPEPEGAAALFALPADPVRGLRLADTETGGRAVRATDRWWDREDPAAARAGERDGHGAVWQRPPTSAVVNAPPRPTDVAGQCTDPALVDQGRIRRWSTT